MYIKGYKKKKEKKLEPSAQEKEKETCPCCYNRMPKLWLVLWWKLEEIQETQVKKQNKTNADIGPITIQIYIESWPHILI